ncbi:hypothetical protein EJ06DRAFT_585285 [Trichodelitschia bisporula]|uniref:Zn(2)-C6 fungal-type domain-containing protein n=1 Tax=Trichodelitschia bisporula TaxID=703511 RepID=A0A6G1HK24_9PEZI|nr:hypothetical protein EJ06DRAFT_585285 [Trichodelitschia bisporula]
MDSITTVQHEQSVPPADASNPHLKRKRSPSNDTLAAAAAAAAAAATANTSANSAAHPPPQKAAKTTPTPTPNPPATTTNTQHLAINYLARQYNEDLPLISSDDSLPSILQLLGEYAGVLERHESMACNLGARPLGPILIKRFERLFDEPPKVLKCHGKEGSTVTWLDVVEFARSKPEQFTLGQRSEGARVCQFYTKQCRVQISEEDYVLISSGIPQKMIPPQPIIEDEDKELLTLEILEKNLNSICHMADQVAARTRQLRHRITGRRNAILDRRANDTSLPIRASSPSHNGAAGTAASPSSSILAQLAAAASAPSAGFVAVNTRSSADNPASNTRSLLDRLFPQPDRPSSNGGEATSPITPAAPFSRAASASYRPDDPYGGTPGAQQRASAGSTPQPTPVPQKDDGGPFKTEMVLRMDSLRRGERVLPPCDRCRRLHMDCIKNLTACQGCTKKHAKCGWRDVRESEVFAAAVGGLEGEFEALSARAMAVEGLAVEGGSGGEGEGGT